eukprot:TRINITY_DN2076_c0_g1_i2.p1 TRINITY_DN2076_c0_g1~~TRINITY_DN2076_c0_g1_i2.p1  ORF type:complete len:351 (-),score=78.76 TRINITY_DN2076_c0_g1_i2:195-1247(-)
MLRSLVGSEMCIRDRYQRRVHGNNWYSTNASILSKDRLFKLISDRPGLVYSCEDENKGNVALSVAYLGVCYWLGSQLYQQLNQRGSLKSLKDEQHKSTNRFTDVYGLEKAKRELQEIIDYLKEPEKYRRVGARLRRGVLLYGPPGTGKTLLARAAAGESNASFLYCAASEFVEMYVGVGAKRIRELFQQARSMAPCIVFIDEIDGVGARRNVHHGEQGSDTERNTTLNQLLTEMDGFREHDNVVVIGATNRANLLDDALMRSGRFDTKIKLEMPNPQERVGILSLHMNKKRHEVTAGRIAEVAMKTDKFSGADLENIVNESAYIAVSKNREFVTDEDLGEAMTKLLDQRK